jgi:hypothetical protein
MNTRAESLKLVELRAKTDRQLVAFINARVDAAVQLSPAEAEKVYAEGRALLPLVYGLTNAERCQLEWKLVQLRELLNDISSDAELKVQTARS